MLLSLFPQRAKDIPRISAASSGLSTSHVIPVANTALESGAPTSIGRVAITGTANGSSVTQATSRTTAVELNAPCGSITLVSAAGSATPFSFTLTNSYIAATDVVVISQKSGTDKYTTQVVTAVAAGSCQITLANASGTTTEQPVFNFVVVKSAIG